LSPSYKYTTKIILRRQGHLNQIFTLERGDFRLRHHFNFSDITTTNKKSYSSLNNTKIIDFETIRTFLILVMSMNKNNVAQPMLSFL